MTAILRAGKQENIHVLYSTVLGWDTVSDMCHRRLERFHENARIWLSLISTNCSIGTGIMKEKVKNAKHEHHKTIGRIRIRAIQIWWQRVPTAPPHRNASHHQLGAPRLSSTQFTANNQTNLECHLGRTEN